MTIFLISLFWYLVIILILLKNNQFESNLRFLSILCILNYSYVLCLIIINKSISLSSCRINWIFSVDSLLNFVFLETFLLSMSWRIQQSFPFYKSENGVNYIIKFCKIVLKNTSILPVHNFIQQQFNGSGYILASCCARF